MTDNTRRVLEFTSRLIDSFGPRPAGSEPSRNCADALRAEAENIADHTRTEDFPFHPGAFLGWIRILVILYAAAATGLWFGFYLVSAVLIAAGLVILVLQFFLYRELLDPFFPKRTGRNVLASLEPAGEVRGELMISGHHDSARIFNFFIFQPGLYALRVTGGIASLALLGFTAIVLSVLKVVTGGDILQAWTWIPSLFFSLLFLLVVQLWWFASSKYSPGAGDNLASSATAWEFLRICSGEKRNGGGFRHLRITAASWDAEEAGLRGARAWRRQHAAEPAGHPLWNLNLECLFSEKDFFLLSSDINGSVALSGSLAGRCRQLLNSGSGLDVPAQPIAFLTGGTDAGETARAGAQSTTLMGMPWGNTRRSAVYHTPDDTVDAVGPEAVAAALRLARDLALELDGELSDPSR